ncbi:MAG: hypothetical protein C0497_04190 [Gemmatimonas sp.]|nr:hypothetical protein [Gemmatimonas sp.]
MLVNQPTMTGALTHREQDGEHETCYGWQDCPSCGRETHDDAFLAMHGECAECRRRELSANDDCYEVLDVTAGRTKPDALSHGTYDSVEEARGCVAFDSLACSEIMDTHTGNVVDTSGSVATWAESGGTPFSSPDGA